MRGRHTGMVHARVDMRKLQRNLADTRQAMADHVIAQMIQLQQQMVAVRPAAASFLDSVAIARDTTSRLARSFALGA